MRRTGAVCGRRGVVLRVHRGERGQTAAEYLGILALVSVVAAALFAGPMGTDIGDAIRDTICRIANPGAAASCGGRDGGTTPPVPDRGLQIACSIDKQGTTQSYDAFLPRFALLAGSSAGEIQQIGPDRWRVAITTENRAGVGTLDGDGPGSRTNAPPKPGEEENEGLRSGRWGMVAATVGGRVTTTYEFGSRQEAEDYLDSRRGGPGNWKGWASAVTGVGGRAIEEGAGAVGRWAQGLYSRVRNLPPPAPEPEPRWVTFGINPRLQGSVGYNGGRGASGEVNASGTLDQTLTLDRGDRLRPPTDGKDPRRWIQSASVEGGVGAMLFPPQTGRSPYTPWGSFGASRGGNVSFRYVSDHNGEPLRLIVITESSWEGGLRAGGGRSDQTNQGRPNQGDRGAGGDVNARVSDVQVTEHHLDLTNAENRAAFEGVFETVIPHVASINPLHLADEQRTRALADRFQRDGVEARFDYQTLGTEGGLGAVDAPAGGKGKMVGLIVKEARSHRTLQEATYIDHAQPGAQWRPLTSCTAPSVGGGTSGEIGGTHGPGGGGTGGAGGGGRP